MEKYRSFAQDIVNHVGGKENITSLRHCVTRLRFRLVDESIADDEYLKNLEGVITVMKAMGEYMVVVGEHVPHVYEEVCDIIGKDVTKSNEPSKKKKSIGEIIMSTIMGAMGPTLNLMCACGLVKGILAIAMIAGLKSDTGLYQLLNALGDSFFYFMPLMLGYNVAKNFDVDGMLGFILAAALCYPTIQGVDINLFGLTVNAAYTSTFLPVVFGVVLAIPIYKFLFKRLPNAVKSFTAPLISLLIVFPLTFLVMGPLANFIGLKISEATNFIVSVSPILAGLLFGGLWQVFVLFGVHGLPIMFSFMDLMQGIPSQLLAFVSSASFAQIGVVLAIYLKTKDKKLKSIALPAFISGIFGVTEPAIYGVTLPRIKMFVISCIGAGIGGLLVAILGIKVHVYAGMGIIAMVGHLDPANPQIWPIATVVIVSFVISFLMAYAIYKDDDSSTETAQKGSNFGHKEEVSSPLSGRVELLSKSEDEAFSSGAIGEGLLVYPDEGKVVAPFDGVVRTLFPTKHAIGIVSDSGCELLVHVGMNTVRLEGEGFTAHVKQGDRVEKGQLLVSFDYDWLLEKGYDLATPVIVTNSDNYIEITKTTKDEVVAGEQLLVLLG